MSYLACLLAGLAEDHIRAPKQYFLGAVVETSRTARNANGCVDFTWTVWNRMDAW
jgi:hypothetical protein